MSTATRGRDVAASCTRAATGPRRRQVADVDAIATASTSTPLVEVARAGTCPGSSSSARNPRREHLVPVAALVDVDDPRTLDGPRANR